MPASAEHETAKPLSELLEPGSTLMVGTTQGAAPLEFRPLTVARVRGSVIEILVDANEDWATGFKDGDALEITMGDNRTNVWLSMHATGALSTDGHLIDELWNPFAAAYFDDGRQSTGIAVLIVWIPSPLPGLAAKPLPSSSTVSVQFDRTRVRAISIL